MIMLSRQPGLSHPTENSQAETGLQRLKAICNCSRVTVTQHDPGLQPADKRHLYRGHDGTGTLSLLKSVHDKFHPVGHIYLAHA